MSLDRAFDRRVDKKLGERYLCCRLTPCSWVAGSQVAAVAADGVVGPWPAAPAAAGRAVPPAWDPRVRLPARCASQESSVSHLNYDTESHTYLSGRDNTSNCTQHRLAAACMVLRETQ